MKSKEVVETLERVLTYLSNPIFATELHSEDFRRFMEDKDKIQALKDGFEDEQFLFLGKYDYDKEDEAPDWKLNYKRSNSNNFTLWDDTSNIKSGDLKWLRKF